MANPYDEALIKRSEERRALPQATGINPRENQVDVKPSAADRTLYVGAHRSLSMLDDLMDQSANFSAAEYDMADSPGKAFLADMIPGDDLTRMAKEKYVYTDPKIRDYMSKGAKLESDFSKLMAGLNLTQFEIRDRQKWSPFADGISQDARESRMRDLQDILTEQTVIFDGLYGTKWGEAVARAKGTMSKDRKMAGRVVLAGLTNEGLKDEAENLKLELQGLRNE